MTDTGPRRLPARDLVVLLIVVIGSAVVTYALIGGTIKWLLS